MLLSGKQVRLRPVEPDDVQYLFQVYNDPIALGEFEVFRPSDWFSFEKSVKERGSAKSVQFVIERISDKAKLGSANYRQGDPAYTNTEIGYLISNPSNRGKGYATEMVRLLVDYLFLNQNIQRIEAYTVAGNLASGRVLEKCGFKKEGTLRKARFVAGTFMDYVIYGLLREEWTPSSQ